jgi:gustatory receptor
VNKIKKEIMTKIWPEVPRKSSSSTRILSFHEAAGTMLFFSQFFGLFPIENIRNRDENKMKFSWISLRTFYSLTFLAFGTAESTLAVRRILRFGFNLGMAQGLFFFIFSMLRAYIIFNINLKWTRIIKYWMKCERPFLSYPYAETGWCLKKKCRIIFAYCLVQIFSKL